MKNNAKNPYIIRVQNGEDEMKVLEEVVDLYLNSKSWDEAGEKTGIHPQTLRTFITRREMMFEEHNPELFRKYMNKTGNKRLSSILETVPIGDMEQFTKDVFSSLPKKMIYFDFLNLMCKYRTGKLTSEDLIAMANEHGVEIIG